MKFLKAKSALIICAVLALFYFTNDFALIDIEKTAIVVAIGIDETEDGYEVTAQIALPQATDAASANDDAVLTSKGKTMFEAIENVAAKSGWHAKLSFCGLIVIGRKVAERSATNLIDYIVTSEKFENSTLAVVSDTTAKEVLLAVTPLDAISSFALEKIVLKNEWMIAPVNVTNVKKFAVSTYSPSKAAYLPVVKIVKGDNKGKEGSSSAVTASTGGAGGEGGSKSSEGSSGQNSSKKDETVVFDVSSCAFFKDGQYVATVGEKETKILNMLNSPVQESYFTAEKNGEKYYFHLTCEKKTLSVTAAEKPSVEYGLSVRVKIVDSTAPAPLDKKDERTKVDDELLSALKTEIENAVNALDAAARLHDCDVLGFKDKLYKYRYDDYNRFSDLPLIDYGKTVNIKVRSED